MVVIVKSPFPSWQQHAGRFFVRVPRNQLALERPLQDALAETGGASQVDFHLSFNLVHD
jgi:hypothetical protein